jgi:hypothetical protein
MARGGRINTVTPPTVAPLASPPPQITQLPSQLEELRLAHAEQAALIRLERASASDPGMCHAAEGTGAAEVRLRGSGGLGRWSHRRPVM